MTIPDSFVEQVRDAYEHLFDLVYLRGHPLAPVLVSDTSLSRRDRAWRLHELLTQAIDELDPGPQAPVFSREWRRHRLMVAHCIDGMEPQAVAEQLAISPRHYYREYGASMEAIAIVLWDRFVEQPLPPLASDEEARSPAHDRIELLSIEAARASMADRQTRLGGVIANIEALLRERLAQQGLTVSVSLPDDLPRLMVAQNVVRQLLLALFGFLIERARDAKIEISAQAQIDTIALSLIVEPAAQVEGWPVVLAERMGAFEEMAAVSGASIEPLVSEQRAGFAVRLPCGTERAILAVDDNDDSLELIRRLLAPHGYAVGRAHNAQEALALIPQLQPLAILLDLMLPGQDGWDFLHDLLAHEETRRIPVIVCSVLQQRELALSLGATAFLRKPVTGAALLALLGELEES